MKMRDHFIRLFMMGVLCFGFFVIAASEQEKYSYVYRFGDCVENRPGSLTWEKCNQASKLDIVANDYPLARKHLIMALLEARKLNPPDLPHREGDYLHRMAYTYLAQGRLENGASLLARALELRVKELGPTHQDVISAQNELGGIYGLQKKYAKACAMMSFDMAAEYGVKARNEGDFVKSEQCFVGVLKQTEKFEPNDPRLKMALKLLLKVYLEQSKLIEAEPLLIRLIDFPDLKDMSHANGLKTAAGKHRPQGRFDKEETLSGLISFALLEKMDLSRPEAESIMSNIGETYALQNKHDEACFLMSFDKCVEYAVSASKEGNHAKAQLYFAGALRKAEKIKPNDPRFLAVLKGLVAPYLAENKFGEAEVVAEVVLKMVLERGALKGRDLASVLNNLAGIYHVQGRFDEEEATLKRVLSIFTKELGLFHPDTIITQNNMVSLYVDQKQFSKAELILKGAIDLRVKELGLLHPYVIADQNKLCGVYALQSKHVEACSMMSFEKRVEYAVNASKEGNHAKAQLYFAEIFRSVEKFEPNDPRFLAALNGLLGAYHAENKLGEMESVLKRALSRHGMKNLDLAVVLNNLAGVYYAQGRFNEEEPPLKRALSIRSKELGFSHPDTIIIQNNLASLYMAQKRFPEAEKILKDSIAIIKTHKGPIPLLKSLLENYASLLQSTGRNNEAEVIIGEFKALG